MDLITQVTAGAEGYLVAPPVNESGLTWVLGVSVVGNFLSETSMIPASVLLTLTVSLALTNSIGTFVLITLPHVKLITLNQREST